MSNLVEDIVWTKTSDDPFTLEFTDPTDADLTFKIVGTDGGEDADYFTITVTKVGDDQGDGTATRTRNSGIDSTVVDSPGVSSSLTQDMLRRAEHWCREQRESFLGRPIEGLKKSPYSEAHGK